VSRDHLTRADLAALARAASGRDLAAVDRLRGGTKKGVYRLTFDDATTAVGYVWSAAENYWPAGDGDGVFAPANDVDLFLTAYAELAGVGARVPDLYLVDRSHRRVPGDAVVLQDVRGGSLQELMGRDPRRAAPVLDRLGDTVRALHAHRRATHGRPGTAGTAPVERLVLDRALRHLAAAAARVDTLADVEHRLADELHARHAAVEPRASYGLIHGELGPDHVLVDDQDRPVLIDIEGAAYFDVEWEHAFLELRLHDAYRRVAVPGLDEARLRLYRLAMYLSLVEGPLRLLDGDFPDRAGMLDIARHNTARTLAELR
jgi:aminoglycoside phosphotransferase (APT) family kinase protein